jgi:hypothetical protein
MSISADPKSSDSRMMLEYDMRMSLKPISIATFSSAPWMTLAVIGSMRLRRAAARRLPSPLARRAPFPFGLRVLLIALLLPSG